MTSVNKVIILGNLGKEPEVRRFPNGGAVCNFSVACSESWRDKATGDRKEKTEWVNVSIFTEGLVKVAEQYLKKGSKVYVEGKLQTRKWQDKDGVDRYTTEVVLNGFGAQLVLLGDKQEGGQRQSQPAQQAAPQGGAAGFIDDSIPF